MHRFAKELGVFQIYFILNPMNPRTLLFIHRMKKKLHDTKYVKHYKTTFEGQNENK